MSTVIANAQTNKEKKIKSCDPKHKPWRYPLHDDRAHVPALQNNNNINNNNNIDEVTDESKGEASRCTKVCL